MPTTEAAPSAADLLKAMSAAGSKKPGKSGTPVLTSPEVAALEDRWIKAQRDEAEGKAMKETIGAQIMALTSEMLVKACRQAGKAMSTIRVGKLNFTSKNQYSVVPLSREDDLRAAFGEEAFATYFNKARTIEMTPAAIENEELVGKLIAALGPELFVASFKVTDVLKPTDAFHQDRLLKDSVAQAAAPFLADQTIKQYAGTLKVA